MNSKTRQAIETHVADAFEAINTPIPKDPADASVTWISIGMILYEAARNSYPQADAVDVAGIVAQHVHAAIQLNELTRKGLAERFTSSNGKTGYRPTTAGRKHVQSILDHHIL